MVEVVDVAAGVVSAAGAELVVVPVLVVGLGVVDVVVAVVGDGDVAVVEVEVVAGDIGVVLVVVVVLLVVVVVVAPEFELCDPPCLCEDVDFDFDVEWPVLVAARFAELECTCPYWTG